MPVTQFGLIKLAKPTTNDDLQKDASYTESVVAVMRRQPGCLKGGWSVIEGKPTSLVWLFVWDKLESHTKFQKSEDFKGVMQAMQSFLAKDTDEPVFIRHFELAQDPYELAGDDAPLQDIICLAMTSDISNEKMMENAKPMREVCEKMGKRQISAISIDKDLSRVYFATNVFKDWKEGKTFADSEPHQKAMKEVPPGGVERFVVGGHFFPVMV